MDSSTEDTRMVERIVRAIHPHLAGHSPEIQSAVIADLAATWLGGFQGPCKHEAREAALEIFIKLVRELVPHNEPNDVRKSAMKQPLPPMPQRIARLPQDHRGFPIPWFVATIPPTGERDFRVADEQKRTRAVRQNLCWVCGERLGQFKAFVIGPMCAVNRVTSEPPCHLECAEFSATACPFLSRPRMRRNDKDLPDAAVDPAGFHIDRNPGAICIWVCKSFRPFKATGGWLIKLDAPSQVRWFAEGKPATAQQVLASINSGYPNLLALAEQQGPAAIAALAAQRDRALQLLPAA